MYRILSFEKLKKIIKIRNKMYYTQNDVEYWKTDVNLVVGFKKNDYILILDNSLFDTNYNRIYCIKYYDATEKKINTLFKNTDINICYKYIANLLNSNIDNDILLTGEIEKNKIVSLYLKKEMEINLIPYDVIKKIDKNQLQDLKKWIDKREKNIDSYKYIQDDGYIFIIKILTNISFTNTCFNDVCTKISNMEV